MAAYAYEQIDQARAKLSKTNHIARDNYGHFLHRRTALKLPLLLAVGTALAQAPRASAEPGRWSADFCEPLVSSARLPIGLRGMWRGLADRTVGEEPREPIRIGPIISRRWCPWSVNLSRRDALTCGATDTLTEKAWTSVNVSVGK
jgi:hypothetical protein